MSNSHKSADKPYKAATGGEIVPVENATSHQSAGSKALSFVKRHPVLTVAGGLAAGVAIAALLPNRTGRRMLGKAARAAEAASEAGLLFGREAADRAGHAGHVVSRAAERTADRAGDAGSRIAGQLGAMALAALAAARSGGKAAARKAGELGEAASDAPGRVVDFASKARSRVSR